MLSMASGLLLIACAQDALAQERNLANQFKSEAGCPVDVVSAKTILDIDSFGTPVDCRIYIDYKNTSSKGLSGVKFRIGYVDSEEKMRGTFHAPDGHVLDPGASASAKWKGERVDPRTDHVVIRVLGARYSDGSMWESEKVKGLAPGTVGAGSAAGSSDGATDAAADAGGKDAGGNEAPPRSSAGAGGKEAPARSSAPASAKPDASGSPDSFEGG